MDEELKRKGYLEGSKLKKAGYDNEIIRSRLDKIGIPERIIGQVIHNLGMQQSIHQEATAEEQKSVSFNVALIRVGIGVALAVISYVIFPEQIILPIGLIGGGVVAAFMAKRA